jgi:hypothetical protein
MNVKVEIDKVNQKEREERCTAPHPVVPFFFFLGTLVLVLMAFYLLF